MASSTHTTTSGQRLSDLHQLCHCGDLRKLKEVVENLDEKLLAERLASKKGEFGYTPIHEAVLGGKADVLDYLLEKTNNAHVNCQTRSGYTPLHLAASLGRENCVRTLLKHNADISIADERGKVPRQTAELSHRAKIAKLLKSEEIIKEVINDGELLTELLQSNTADQLEPNCLERALMAATVNNNHFNIGKLVVKGAKNLEECLDYAQRNSKSHACAMLMLIKAAITGNKAIVQKLFGETVDKPDNLKEFCDTSFSDVQNAVLSGRVSTVVPIEIACRNGHLQVRDELLLKTGMNQEEGYVYWHGLNLLQLEVSWLQHIYWVKRLRLARNGFKRLPREMGNYLKQVVKIDLQHNELADIPRCLLELPSLGELNLSHNKLTEIPNVPEWSANLTALDLSFNQLYTIPINAVAPIIRSLNLSHNKFRTVPLRVCSFITLHSLNLSDNPDIRTLPAEMGRLSMLNRLNLNNLKYLNDPPKKLQKDVHDCIRYLYSQLHCTKGFYRMTLMVLGLANRGKTTLVKRLLNLGGECVNEPTINGIDVTEWWFKPSLGKKPFHFSVWDFAGQQEYYAIHQCFLSPRSLYLLLFNLTHGENGVQELKPWLNNLTIWAPHSVVIIVGTHLDLVAEEKREEIDTLLYKVGELAESYCDILQIVEVMPVGLMNCVENVGLLKEAIYNHAANYKTRTGLHIMGQKIPASYHALVKQMEVVQQEVRQGLREPIMHSEEFTTMVQQMNLADIQDEEELKRVTLFLTHVGSLLHYKYQCHNIHKLYFVDPSWLFKMMSKVVTVGKRSPLLKNGILYAKDIPVLFKDEKFPWKYLEQFLTLLDHYEIALLLDNGRVLIPSMLSDKHPEHLLNLEEKPNALAYSRYILFNSVDTPPGFWERLLSLLLHSIPQVCSALDKTALEENASGDILTGTFSSSCSPKTAPDLGSNTSSYDHDIQLYYWRTGLYYCDPKPLMFRVESFATSPFNCGEKDGVLITASPNDQGKKIICQLVDLVLSLINQWYPGLTEGHHVEQKVPCFECLKLERPDPFEFQVENCLRVISKYETTMKCGYLYMDEQEKNHTVSLADIVPDLLLQDIDPNLMISAEGISYQEDQASFLGKGGYGRVYRGKCQGKSVAIKKYIMHREDINVLRSEAKLLQQSHHPCVVSLIGVCAEHSLLVLEEAPLMSIEFAILRKNVPVHRLTIFRIAAEVTAALQFLHSQGIIFRNIKAANVLLWTLDPYSLCHCKITDFCVATHTSPVGVKGVFGTKGFIAPEVLDFTQRSLYDHKADIFSFSMFLYQLIAHRLPYHDTPPDTIHMSVLAGKRPKLQDVDVARTGYHYLTMLMKKCWEDNPEYRSTTEEIIKTVCLTSTQSVMCVFPVHSKFDPCSIIALTPANFVEAGILTKLQNELWVCCDGAEGAELSIYDANVMLMGSQSFIKDNQVQCMALCNDHIWVSSRAGIEYGIISIFNIATRELVHNIRMRENFVSCLAATKDQVFIGTLEGYCLTFSSDINSVRSNAKPKYIQVSKQAIDGITCTSMCVWVSHTNYISFINIESLTLEGSVSRDQEGDVFIGQLSASPDEDIIWSAHLGGVILTAWDTHNRLHSFNINTCKVLTKISSSNSPHNAVITAMLPALDTVWVGMATGHIMVFHKEELLTWFQPYTEYVRCLSIISGSGPCKTEKCMVVSGGKGFVPLVEGLGPDYEKKSGTEDHAGVLVIWEAFEARFLRQITLVEKRAPGFFDSYGSVRSMIIEGDFKDGTYLNEIVQKQEKSIPQDIFLPVTSDSQFLLNNSPSNIVASSEQVSSQSFAEHPRESVGVNTGKVEDPILENEPTKYQVSEENLENLPIISKAEKVMFDIILPGQEVVCVGCPNPPQLKVLLSEIKFNTSLDEADFLLQFEQAPGNLVKVDSQRQLEAYLALGPSKPKLHVALNIA